MKTGKQRKAKRRMKAVFSSVTHFYGQKLLNRFNTVGSLAWKPEGDEGSTVVFLQY